MRTKLGEYEYEKNVLFFFTAIVSEKKALSKEK